MCVKMKFSVVFLRKQAIFHYPLGQLFVMIFKQKDEICHVVLQLQQAISQLFVEVNLIKICSQKLG